MLMSIFVRVLPYGRLIVEAPAAKADSAFSHTGHRSFWYNRIP